VTIKDIAKYAGVSTATVSRVINNTGFVSPEYEDKVLKVIEEVGYVPNSIARSLKMTTTYTVGFLVSDISNKYFMSIAKSIEDVIGREKFNLIVASTEGDAERELTYLNMFLGKKVDGIIINTTGKNDNYIAKLSRRVPTILLHRKLTCGEFVGDLVDSNNISGGYSLAKELLLKGHKEIAIISGPLNLSTGKERYEGMVRAFKEHDLEFSEEFLYEGDFTLESGYSGAKEILSKNNKPSAIILANNQMAIGALTYLKESNINIPEDISVVVYGNIDLQNLLFVNLTSTTQDPWALGKRAGELILNRIDKGRTQNVESIFDSSLIIGDSVKALT